MAHSTKSASWEEELHGDELDVSFLRQEQEYGTEGGLVKMTWK
jgi:hypothetical protein